MRSQCHVVFVCMQLAAAMRKFEPVKVSYVDRIRNSGAKDRQRTRGELQSLAAALEQAVATHLLRGSAPR